jgi:putative penicillin-binding protein 2
MKKTVALLVSAVISGSMLVACTPKPASADPVAQDFLDAMAERDAEALSEVIDNPQSAVQAIDETFTGLQAEGLTTTLADVDVNDSIATARYSMHWNLPRDRELVYETEMTLTKASDEWTVRYKPTIIHPDLGANQHLELRAVEAARASVVSSDGVELLSPGVSHRLLVDAAQLEDPRAAAARIASAVNAASGRDATISTLDAGELASSLESIDGIYSVGVYSADAGPTIVDDLSDIPGVQLNEEPAMVPLEKDFAPDIMSRVTRIVGDDLEGANGWKVSVVNPHGAALSDVSVHEADPAPALKIAIDYNVQRAAQDAVALRQDKQTMLVAMRPSTGEILAVAQTPAADKDGDIALNGHYPPGSVFKIITAAAGIEHQGLNPQNSVGCPGVMNIQGRTVVNYNQFSLGTVPLQRAFAASCNTTFAEMSTNLAPGELEQTGKKFGLGIDYDIPGLLTITGEIPEGETAFERTEAGYGQGLDLASPFGFALVSSTVAAGYRPVPTLIEGHETKPSEELPGPSPAAIDGLRSMMREVVVSGTAAGMQAGGTIHGKTGEAEYSGGSHAWFTGFRDDDIAFATLIVDGGGSTTAVNVSDRFFQRLDELRAGTGSYAEPGPLEE